MVVEASHAFDITPSKIETWVSLWKRGRLTCPQRLTLQLHLCSTLSLRSTVGTTIRR